MFKWIKALFKLIGFIVLAGVAVTLLILYRGGAFKTLEPHFDGDCTTLELDGSAEDIQIDRDRGFAYLSLIDRKALVTGDGAQGTIGRVDLNQRPLKVDNALATKPDHFRPHGMSIYIDENGQRHLFVINHPVNRGTEPEMVELFHETAPGSFEHVETFGSPLINAPNDLVAVGPRQFYIANDAVAGGGWKAALQQFGIGFSTLVYIDGDNAEIIAEDIASGGGINVSADGQTLYVSETSGQRVRTLARTSGNGVVTDLGSVAIGTSPDNIDVAEDGSLWIGAHANTLKLIQHFINGTPAPSQVVRVQLTEGTNANIDEIYLDDGNEISASSVGATYRDQLLIGSITDRKVLVCNIPD
jgi:arylesterase/paraoxonase